MNTSDDHERGAPVVVVLGEGLDLRRGTAPLAKQVVHLGVQGPAKRAPSFCVVALFVFPSFSKEDFFFFSGHFFQDFEIYILLRTKVV